MWICAGGWRHGAACLVKEDVGGGRLKDSWRLSFERDEECAHAMSGSTRWDAGPVVQMWFMVIEAIYDDQQ